MKRFRGEAFLDAQNPDHFYYNATIVNISTDPDPAKYPSVSFSDNRSVPLIGDIGDYEFSVVRFTTEGAGKALPVFMPRVQLGQPDPDLTVYSVGIAYNDQYTDSDGRTVTFNGYAARYVKYVTEWSGAEPGNPPLTEQDVQGIYYNVSCIQNWLDIVNATSALCITDPTPYVPGSSTYMLTDSIITQFNNSFYLNTPGTTKIESGINDQFLMISGQNNFLCTITPGTYGPTQLAQAVQTAISNAGLPNIFASVTVVPQPNTYSKCLLYFQNGAGGAVVLFCGPNEAINRDIQLRLLTIFGTLPLDSIEINTGGGKVLISTAEYMTLENQPLPPTLTVTAPIITYSPTSTLFQIYAQTGFYAPSVLFSSAQFFMNENTRDLFNNFQFKYLGQPLGKIYQLGFYILPGNTNVLQDSTLLFVTQENESTSSLWCPVQNITFCSTLIPIVPEGEAPPLRVGGNAQNLGQGVSSNMSRIITDISADKTSAYAYNGSIVYIPQGEYRVSDFQGSGALREIEVTVFWKNAIDGRLYPLPLPNGSVVTIKMLFRRKH
jgi:hypothetical protein